MAIHQLDKRISFNAAGEQDLLDNPECCGLLLKGCPIVGVFWGSFTQRERDLQRRNAAELWQMFESGQLKPVVGEMHALEDYAAAFESLAGRRALGKVVLRP